MAREVVCVESEYPGDVRRPSDPAIETVRNRDKALRVRDAVRRPARVVEALSNLEAMAL